MRNVATILILENDPAVAELLAMVVRRLGYTPHDPRAAGLPDSFDALVFEPGDPGTLDWAHHLRSLHPELPLVVASIYGRFPEVLELEPVAYLLKPFPLLELERILTAIVEG
jgi:CheY-like chemotaxis protein